MTTLPFPIINNSIDSYLEISEGHELRIVAKSAIDDGRADRHLGSPLITPFHTCTSTRWSSIFCLYIDVTLLSLYDPLPRQLSGLDFSQSLCGFLPSHHRVA